MIVDKTGKPSDLKIIQSAGAGVDASVLAAVSQYRFTPGMVSNQPIATPLNLEVVISNTIGKSLPRGQRQTKRADAKNSARFAYCSTTILPQPCHLALPAFRVIATQLRFPFPRTRLSFAIPAPARPC
jgi:hypothetical protein